MGRELEHGKLSPAVGGRRVAAMAVLMGTVWRGWQAVLEAVIRASSLLLLRGVSALRVVPTATRLVAGCVGE